MNLLDTIETEHGTATVVGFPTLDLIEVRLHRNGELHVLQRSGFKNETVLRSEEPAQDVPRSPRTGKPLVGIALAKHLAKQREQGR